MLDYTRLGVYFYRELLTGVNFLIDLSKAFDTLDHDLLIAKLSAYGLNFHSLHLIKNYLSDRHQRTRIESCYQRTRIESCYSGWLEMSLGIPQGSILGPLLFKTFINNLLFLIASICNFADNLIILSSHVTRAWHGYHSF